MSVTEMKITREEIENFLYHEAELLDEWKLKEWVTLFTDNGSYIIPPVTEPDAEFPNNVFLAYDDRARLEQRALRLLKKEAHVEFPHSTTLHNISNIRIEKVESNVAYVKSNFITYRTKRQVLDTFIGVNEYQLVFQNQAIKIQQKKVKLKLDNLRPQGKVSFIL
ncbi:p-cumate 2,3-dioxygenase beta subunit [Alteribacillus persepolensis]|uniref:p-cumate 2,3-dioxygenase beta subunit n=1 Tax=Alteribacillus persepolensis TaxID=568899 RepID=A0A1G8EDX3_9BACI|nr:aromatic-ring-hydroxylating dioxygenase subunit beta [Alteribacillus persepolensis]SDH68113.1 p-cumate 2,3-dioxygenase beta subunit [Alteribacillus persepolensis]